METNEEEINYTAQLVNEAEEIYNGELYNLFCENNYDEYEKIYNKLENLKLTNNDILSDAYFVFYAKYFREQAVEQLKEIKQKLADVNSSTAGV